MVWSWSGPHGHCQHVSGAGRIFADSRRRGGSPEGSGSSPGSRPAPGQHPRRHRIPRRRRQRSGQQTDRHPAPQCPAHSTHPARLGGGRHRELESAHGEPGRLHAIRCRPALPGLGSERLGPVQGGRLVHARRRSDAAIRLVSARRAARSRPSALHHPTRPHGRHRVPTIQRHLRHLLGGPDFYFRPRDRCLRHGRCSRLTTHGSRGLAGRLHLLGRGHAQAVRRQARLRRDPMEDHPRRTARDDGGHPGLAQ